MITAARASGAVIRKAGKASAVLQLFALVLLALLAYIYSDISGRYTSLQDGIRENAMWSVYQLDRETRRLREETSILVARNKLGPSDLKILSLRYDILYSRMSMLNKARFEKNFQVDDVVKLQLVDIQTVVYGYQALFDAIASGENVGRGKLTTLLNDLGTLSINTDRLLSYTNNARGVDRADARSEVIALERKSALLIALLVLIVVALIFTLRRQLTSVRAAGLTLESMATNLDRAYKSAEAGNRAKSQFMATMGHEIRTPLNAILGMVELLELQDLPQDSISNLRTIRKSGEALLDIINEILDFAKIEHGMLELECRVIDVRACAENAAELMRSRAADTGNRILVELPDALLAPYVWSDPTRLRQIVLNLVSNAVKFTSKGVITLRLSETLVSDQLRLRVEVRDTGIGIDETGLAKLFQPFSQVDASISRKYGGTGLGLTICKEIVERFNGEIGVESTLGIGSTFWFEIPVKPSDIAPASVALPAEPTMPDLPILDILVVEDNLVNLQVATKFLEHLQQRVWGAANGSIGVEMACDRHFDVILMDMQMPVMDGIEAAALIRSGDGLSAKSPIFAMTANASEGDRQKCMEAGMDGFQSKPISIAQLRLLLSGIHPAERAAGTADRSLPLLLDTVASDPPSAFHIRKAEMVDALGEQEFHELLETFFDDASGILKELQSALEIGDTRATDRLLHALKGAAGNMGLAEIAATSDQMRGQRLDAGNVQTLAAELHAFHSKLVA